MGIIGSVLLFTILSVGAFLGFWIMSSNPKEKMNKWFFAIATFILLWNIFAFLGYRSVDALRALAYFRLNFAAVSLFFIAFYHFTIFFPIKTEKRTHLLDAFAIAGGLFFTVASLFTNLIIKEVKIPAPNKLILATGFLGNAFYGFTLILTGIIIYNLFLKYSILNKSNRSKINYFLVGTLLYAFFNVIFSISFSFFYPENYQYTQFGDFSAIFFLGFTAYAIMKHGMFDIKVIATEATVIVLSITLFVQIFISVTWIEGLVNAIIWVAATYGGWQLIRGVKLEIKRRREVQKLAKELENANDHLKDLDKLKDNFMSMASHELNTPIAAIEGYLSMILDENLAGEVNPKARKFLDNVYKSSKRLAALVKDLLSVSRIESGRVHLIYEEAQIEEIVKQAISEVAPQGKEYKHSITFNKPVKPLPKIWCDISRNVEVLINLLGNSIKYTPPGGKIEVSASVKDKFIILSVKDNGRGIPKDRREVVFQKFSQVDVMKDEVKGTGLGLFISKNLVELQKGKIWFESDGEGKGTTFFFTLPILDKKPLDPHEGEGPILQLKEQRAK